MDAERGSGDGEEESRTGSKGAIAQADAAKSFDWKSNDDLLNQLNSLGIDKNTARKAIYHTSVDSKGSNIEKCMDYIFTYPNPVDLSKTSLEEELGLEAIYQIGSELSLDDNSKDEYKMVFVINESLNMSTGKKCSQTAHAALALASEIMEPKYIQAYQIWLTTGQTKIVLSADSTAQLDQLQQKATSLGLANSLIHDAGRTEIPSNSKTVLGIFGSINEVNKVTGKLRLVK